MKISHIITSSIRTGRLRLAALVAVLAVAGTLLAPGLGLGGSVSAQSSFPESRSDCADWRDYRSLHFKNRGDCTSWVNAQNHNDNGYGGGNHGNNGNGGGFGNFFSRLFGFIGQLFQLIGNLLGRWF